MRRRILRLVLPLGLLPLAGACREPAPDADTLLPTGLETAATPEPATLQTVTAGPAHLRTGPGGRSFEVAARATGAGGGYSRRFGTKTLPTSLRVTGLTATPCTSCHVGARVMDRTRVADAHQNVQPVHPAETGAACATCHDARNVERLALGSGETAPLDQAYRLCAQCHFGQVESWAGGAHGKRLDGWRGRRVVMGCADCHDPHSPGIPKRIPFPGPSLPAQGHRP
jgi:hypothetical protein